MTLKKRLHDYVMITVYYLGWFTVFVLFMLALLFAFIKIDAAASHQHLSHGYVTEKYMDEGRYWYSSWTFGNYTISKRHGGSASYCVTVEDGDARDYWTLDEMQWQEIDIGDYIRR